MTELEAQFAEWSRGRASIERIFSRTRFMNIKEQCFRLFDLNLLYLYPLIPVYAGKAAAPELAANMVAIVNSQLPQIGTLIIQQILARAKAQLRQFGGASGEMYIFMAAHLYKLKAIDAYPLLQILVCLKRESQWRLLSQILSVAGADLKKESRQAFEYIQQETGASHASQVATLDIVLDNYKFKEDYDITKLDVQPAEFDFDAKWGEKVAKYELIKREILGEESESEVESEEEECEAVEPHTRKSHSQSANTTPALGVQVPSEVSQALHPPSSLQPASAASTQLKKTIYLTIMSSLSTQEACHKLLALGNRTLVALMLYETCKQQKIYNKSFGSIGYHMCRVSPEWSSEFAKRFKDIYSHELDECSTPEIRNMGTLSGYLIASNSISWEVFEVVKIDPDNSTPSNRIFLQSLFEELRREIGLAKIITNLMQLPKHISNGILPIEGDKKALMFSINFFTAIKMGPLTDDMRVELKRREGVA